MLIFKANKRSKYGIMGADRAAPENQDWVFQVQHYDISDQGVSSYNAASEDQQCCRNNGSGHSGMASMRG